LQGERATDISQDPVIHELRNWCVSLLLKDKWIIHYFSSA
jgi:hypothetical protein